MRPAKTNFIYESLPATFGGQGWQARIGSHLDDLRVGEYWRRSGVNSESAELRAVLLFSPGSELCVKEDPNKALMLENVDLDLLRMQHRNLTSFFASRGIEVHIFSPRERLKPNLIFMRDLFFLTPHGAVLSRMAAVQRAGEERVAALALSELAIPIIAMPRGIATVEGADVLWLRDDCVLVGVGQRTNREGYEFVADLLAEMDVDTIPIPMSSGTQHLLGVVNFVARDLAVVRRRKAPTELLDALKRHGVSTISLPDDEDVVIRRAANFLCLGDFEIVMPADCPTTKAVFKAHGIKVTEMDVSEYIKAGGALGCLTGILHRG